MSGSVPNVALMVTMEKSASARRALDPIPGPSSGRRELIRGTRYRIEATAAKESWKDTSNREAGENIRITKTANASVLGRSLSLSRSRAARKTAIITVALTVEMPKPAMNANAAIGMTEQMADILFTSNLSRSFSEVLMSDLSTKKTHSAMMLILKPEMAMM